MDLIRFITDGFACKPFSVYEWGMAEDPQMKIRLPRKLKAQIEAASGESNRTQNGEIVARLERTFIEDEERAKGWLDRLQSAPGIQAAKRELKELVTLDAIREEMAGINARVAEINKQLEGMDKSKS